jgi:AAA+ superfamily predicted ATPase
MKEKNKKLFDVLTPPFNFGQLFYSPKVTTQFRQIVDEWKNVERLKAAGLFPVHRILVGGRTGCGKTTLGLALAEALVRNVVYVHTDKLFANTLLETMDNIQSVFDTVKDSHQILFLDEFDAIANDRSDELETGNLKHIVLTVLRNLEYLPKEVIVIATTNCVNLLDGGVFSRFDVNIDVFSPDDDVCKSMIKEWLKPYPEQTKNVNIDALVKALKSESIYKIKRIILQTIKKVLFIDCLPEITTNDFDFTL